jgi:hypothetical protein
MANTGNKVFSAQMTRIGPINTKNSKNKINSTTKFVVLFIVFFLQSLQFSQFLLDGFVLSFSAHRRALLVNPPHMFFTV